MHVTDSKTEFIDLPRSARNVSSQTLVQLTEEELRAAMQSIRSRVKKQVSGGGDRQRAIFSHELARGLKRKHKQLTAGTFQSSKSAAPQSPTPNVIAEALFPSREKAWRVKGRKFGRINVNSFSFIDDPISTLGKLREIAVAECEFENSELNFRMPYCVDIAPMLVLGLMRRDMMEVFKGGRVTATVDKVLRAVQLPEFLQMGLRSDGDQTDVWAFPIREADIRERSDIELLGNNTRDKVAHDLSSKLNEWLEVATATEESYYCFSDTGRDFLKTMVCEILENSERHGHESQLKVGSWACAGFLAKRPSTSKQREFDFVCHLAFVNTGQTISDGLANSNHPETVNAQDVYIKSHGASVLKPRGIDHSLLRTVLALQPGITRHQIEDTNSGGVGFRRILDAVYHLNEKATESPPKTVIISGNCCVKVSGLYSRHARNSQGVLGLYFNEENSRQSPPDSEYVFKLPSRFPGTIIATRFLIDPKLPTVNSQ